MEIRLLRYNVGLFILYLTSKVMNIFFDNFQICIAHVRPYVSPAT